MFSDNYSFLCVNLLEKFSLPKYIFKLDCIQILKSQDYLLYKF